MRGEEAAARCCAPAAVELPPHARRRGGGALLCACGGRITSACAEKSAVAGDPASSRQNYLRMRGEELAP